MKASSVATELRTAAKGIEGSMEDLAKLLLKAADMVDELRIETEVQERLLVRHEKAANQLPRLLESVGSELIGLRIDLRQQKERAT